jgi:hypothetical protein
VAHAPHISYPCFVYLIPGKGTNAVRSTLIAFLLLTCVADVGFAQTLLDTTIVHGIGAKSCGEYLSAVSDHAPWRATHSALGLGVTLIQTTLRFGAPVE